MKVAEVAGVADCFALTRKCYTSLGLVNKSWEGTRPRVQAWQDKFIGKINLVCCFSFSIFDFSIVIFHFSQITIELAWGQ